VKPEFVHTTILTAVEEEKFEASEPSNRHYHHNATIGEANLHHRDHHSGHCGRGGRGKGWKQFANTMANMFGRGFGTSQETEEHEGENEDWGFGGKRSKWSEQRAVVIGKPKEPVVGHIGEMIFVPIEIQN
jgi:hypothetical protein